MMETLTALSPIDGRYANQSDDLRAVCSEYGLIHYRLWVEVRWLQALAACPDIKELPAFNQDELNYLDTIIDTFNLDCAKAIKAFEKTTQHDVKAVEYFLKKKLLAHPQLKS